MKKRSLAVEGAGFVGSVTSRGLLDVVGTLGLCIFEGRGVVLGEEDDFGMLEAFIGRLHRETTEFRHLLHYGGEGTAEIVAGLDAATPRRVLEVMRGDENVAMAYQENVEAKFREKEYPETVRGVLKGAIACALECAGICLENACKVWDGKLGEVDLEGVVSKRILKGGKVLEDLESCVVRWCCGANVFLTAGAFLSFDGTLGEHLGGVELSGALAGSVDQSVALCTEGGRVPPAAIVRVLARASMYLASQKVAVVDEGFAVCARACLYAGVRRVLTRVRLESESVPESTATDTTEFNIGLISDGDDLEKSPSLDPGLVLCTQATTLLVEILNATTTPSIKVGSLPELAARDALVATLLAVHPAWTSKWGPHPKSTGQRLRLFALREGKQILDILSANPPVLASTRKALRTVVDLIEKNDEGIPIDAALAAVEATHCLHPDSEPYQVARVLREIL